MASKPNIFFIIGAPTSLTFQKFEEFNSKNTNVKLVICADMPTYIKALNSANVFDGPTNFRAHADDFTRTFHTANGDITTDTKENFKKLQKDIATSLYDIFKTASVKQIETYFAIVPREERPLLLVNKRRDPEAKGKIISTPQEDLAVGAHAHNYSHPYFNENVDLGLTEDIRDELLIPKVYGSAEKLHKLINDKEISKYGATFLSDMITVGCAGLLKNSCFGFWRNTSKFNSIGIRCILEYFEEDSNTVFLIGVLVLKVSIELGNRKLTRSKFLTIGCVEVGATTGW